MKKTYAFLISGALLSMSLAGCSSENTTGVDTQTTTNEVDGKLNDPQGGTVTEENVSPLDTADTNNSMDAEQQTDNQ
ncbi:hypothetical protein MKJ04_07635 [Pontibacter sp. E15-1]|uniref:hypothetical protein n=1 Tax=Pontibacter sp. E15-1 TaxID=2919918 RepID=UPI001F4FCEDD|nr:hypothetical protein [Pontibacter sp. E15-1]MCJ8164710.1 hypothetical protein [Pontibacter sp. E15-1]